MFKITYKARSNYHGPLEDKVAYVKTYEEAKRVIGLHSSSGAYRADGCDALWAIRDAQISLGCPPSQPWSPPAAGQGLKLDRWWESSTPQYEVPKTDVDSPAAKAEREAEAREWVDRQSRGAYIQCVRDNTAAQVIKTLTVMVDSATGSRAIRASTRPSNGRLDDFSIRRASDGVQVASGNQEGGAILAAIEPQKWGAGEFILTVETVDTDELTDKFGGYNYVDPKKVSVEIRFALEELPAVEGSLAPKPPRAPVIPVPL